MFEKEQLEFLRELLKHRVPFMLVGLSAATLQGAPVVTQDIDLWFKRIDHPGIKKALKSVDGVFVPSFGHNAPGFAGKSVEFFDMVTHMSGLKDFEKEEEHVITIQVEDLSLPVLKLERIIASKKAANRQKDRLVLPVLEDTLKTIQHKEKKVRT